MAITIPVLMTRRTHSALMAYCENLADSEQDCSANILAGELISEALRVYGFIERAERVKISSGSIE